MKFTGERVVPDKMGDRPDIYSEHLVRYAIAMNYCSMNDVLDIACGTGYGTDLLGSVSNSITGGDNDIQTLDYARDKYGLNLKEIDLEQQTIQQIFKKKFNIIVSFETIEHLVNPQFFLDGVKKSLSENGLFIFSIPVQNRGSYHKHLYTYEQAAILGNNKFKTVRTFVQRSGMVIHPAMANGDFNSPGTYIIKVMK
jgi:2-polyprenyl-3-methyl-5-hydroxy-6-metoxy-1,4-benzoquinol methylase